MDIATAITKHAHEDNQDKALVEVLHNVMVEKNEMVVLFVIIIVTLEMKTF